MKSSDVYLPKTRAGPFGRRAKGSRQAVSGEARVKRGSKWITQSQERQHLGAPTPDKTTFPFPLKAIV